MSKKNLSESDICAKYITPAVIQVEWDEALQIQRGIFFTKGHIIVLGKAKWADYIFYYRHFPIALIEVKDSNHPVGDRANNVRKHDFFTKYGSQARAVLEALLDEGMVSALDNAA